MDATDQYLAQNYHQYSVPVTPPGLQAIYTACRKLYPTQPNPLQVTAVVKYWLGGPDPLDYISMYSNPGNPDRGIPAHWHYVSFGLTDLHGDGRVHECSGPESPSGFGFELTFRLKREPGDSAPPTWPAALMQALARYVFQSENTLCVGDHIPWHSPLDGSESRIQHMLMTEDPQLHNISSQHGGVNFVQIVGVCAEELKAAQHWNGAGVLELLKTIPVAGGSWCLTDMRRGETVFEIDPQLQDQVDAGIEVEGSNLTGVTSRCSWEQTTIETLEGRCQDDKCYHDDEENKENHHRCRRKNSNEHDNKLHISQLESDQIKQTLKKGLSNRSVLPPIKSETIDNHHHHSHTDHNKNRSRKQSFDSTVSSETPTELLRTRVLDSVHLRFNLEAGALLPLALKGRLKHGRHFTFKSVMNDTAVTLVSSSVVGSFADEENPFAAHGPWLQVLLTEDFIAEMVEDMRDMENPEDILTPKTYSWPQHRLMITVLPDES